MLILHDPTTLLHTTVELLGSKLRPALESPERISSIVEHISTLPQHHIHTLNPTSSDLDTTLSLALASHNESYITHLRNVHAHWLSEGLITADESVLPECFRFSHAAHTTSSDLSPPQDPFARAGYYAFDMSSGISEHSWQSIIASANLAREAVVSLKKQLSKWEASDKRRTAPSVVALTRPPGHHCTGTLAGGYCYLNNTMIAHEAYVRSLSESSSTPPRIAILDLDFHHGNGTQDLTYHLAHTLYVSIHGEGEFPYYTGYAHETGLQSADAEGTNLNIPLPPRSEFQPTYVSALETAVTRVREFGPELLLVSLGFDTFYTDPLGGFDVREADYGVMARMVRKGIGKEMPVVVLLEGGYVVEKLGTMLERWCEGWEGVDKDGGQ